MRRRRDDFDALSLGRQFLPDAFLVAMDGDRLVGLTEPIPVDNVAEANSQSLTGVRSDYRGRGARVRAESCHDRVPQEPVGSRA